MLGLKTTQLSLEYLRGKGYEAEITEHWNAFGRRRKDLWGADIAAVHFDLRPALVQTTTKGHMLERLYKMREIPALIWWLGHCDLFIHGWFRSAAGSPRLSLWELIRDQDLGLIHKERRA